VERRYRLSRSKDFDAVYRQGRSVSTRYLTLHWFPRDDDPLGEPRLGLSVPKAVGNAVVRNRIKRRIREAFRLHRAEIGSQWAIVVTPRRAALNASFPEIQRALGKVIEHCNKQCNAR